MKKLINSPDHVLDDALVGLAAAHPSLTVNTSDRYIARAGGPTLGKVGLVSGGGSGHEPLHGGFGGPRFRRNGPISLDRLSTDALRSWSAYRHP